MKTEALCPAPKTEPKRELEEDMGEAMQLGVARLAPQSSDPWGPQKASDTDGKASHRQGHPLKGSQTQPIS